LNALQNACVADCQGQLTDEGGNTWHVAGDSYHCVIGLIGIGSMGDGHHDGADDE
jgi:hypothetical protein